MAAKKKKQTTAKDLAKFEAWADRLLNDEKFQEKEAKRVRKLARKVEEMPLNERQEVFVGLLTIDPRMSYREAAKEAGYSKPMGAKLMEREDIQAHLEFQKELNAVGRVLLLDAWLEGQEDEEDD